MFDFASTIAPASLMRLTRNASLFDTNPWSDSEPPALCRPIVSKLSLTMAGTQWSGPASPLWRNRRSRSSASFSAFGLVDDDGVDRRALLVVGVDPRAGTRRPARGRSGAPPSSRHGPARWSFLRRGRAEIAPGAGQRARSRRQTTAGQGQRSGGRRACRGAAPCDGARWRAAGAFEE